MEFRVLGPLEVVDGERPLSLGGAKQRALLAAILLRAPETVSTDRLIDELWADPPQTARQTVQVYVSQLRKALGDGRLATRGRGYALEVEDGELDLHRFEALVADGRRMLSDGRPEEAAELLREALALWRGAPLADLAYEQSAQAEIARLEERRLVCLEQRIDADLALGRHADLAGELESLVAAHPYRESFREQLMLALYRSGRQAEALEAFRTARRTFVEELGLEPSPSLQDLERRILAHDPELAAPTDRAEEADASRPRAAAGRRPLALAAAGALLLAAAVALALTLSSGQADPALTSVAGSAVGLIEQETGRIVAQIPVGNAPTAVAAGEGAVWVVNADDRTVSRIDEETKDVRTFGTGSTPLDVAVGGGSVWIANGEPNERAQFLGPLISSVSQLDPATEAVRATIPLPSGSTAFVAHGSDQLAVAGGSLWAALPGGSLARIGLRSRRVDATVDGVAALALASDGRAVWAIDADGTIKRISPRTNSVTARVRLEAASLDSLAVGAGAVWVGSSKEGVVWRLDVGAGVVARTIEVGRGVNGLAVGDSGVWAVNGLRGTLTRIDADRNAVVETIHVGNTPRAAVVAADGVWVAVQGSTGGALAAPTADATPGALPASSCGPVYHAGAWPPDALIVSDFPLQGGLRFSTGQMEEAIAFVLREREFRAGRFRVAYQSCDDSLASTGIYDVAKCASNAEAYAANELVLGVIGTVNSDCAVAAIPILNEATGGPLAMVSPLNSHPGLTRPGHGLSIAELYPTGKRTYARVYPSDDYQGAALALLAQELGARRVAVVGTRGEAYADLVARSFRRAAASLGLEIAVSTAFDPQAESYEQLADRVAAARPDAVFVAGLLDTNGARVVADLRAALGGTVPILVPDGFTPLPLFTEQAGEAAEGVYVSLLGLPALEQAGEVLTAKARRFIAEFGATQPSGVEPSALFAAEAANVLLDAIARSDGTRASVVDQLLAGETNDGFLGTFRFDENGDTTLNPVSIYRVTGRGGVTRILGVDGGTLDRVLTPPSRLVHE